MKNLMLLLGFLLQSNLAAFGGNPWQAPPDKADNHPDVVAVRGIFQVVQKDLASGKLRKQYRQEEHCGPLGEARTIFSDQQGHIRKYLAQGGSEDSALTFEYYYDEAGKLRFVFITGGAVNGSRLEHRIYFDAKGARIRELHTYTKGPGYTFPQVWPDDQLAHDPKKAFADDCADD